MRQLETTQALFSAITAHDLNALETLIKAGAPVNTLNEEGDCPLMLSARLAASDNAYPIVDCLLKHGADVHVKDIWGITLIDYAFSEENPRLLALALHHGATLEDKSLDAAWITLAQTDHVDLMQMLLARGANLNTRLPEERLYAMAHIEVHPLHRWGGMFATEDFDDLQGSNALILAANFGCNSMVNWLLTLAIDINAETDDGATALDFALAKNHVTTAALIRAAGGASGSNPVQNSTADDLPDNYFANLVAQLKVCMPDLDVNQLLSQKPPSAFYDEYGSKSTVLYWLYDGLSAQDLIEYQEWKEYWGDLPKLKPLQGLALEYYPQSLQNALDATGEVDFMADLEPTVYIESMNHHLKPHGLQIISFAGENLYLLCVQNNDAQIKKLANMLSLAGIDIVTHEALNHLL